MKLRTIIIDDEPIALEKLKSYVEKVPFLELVAVCGSGFEAIEFLSGNEADLIFSDINMPDLNGIDFVRTLSNPPMVVFITAYEQYAVDSFRLNVIDYILKPYSFVDFQRAANKAYDIQNIKNGSDSTKASSGEADAEHKKSLFVKIDYRYVRINLSDITYIKGYGEYLQIFMTGSSQRFITLSSFAAIKEKLADSFLQIHRSYIVNMNQVKQIERGRVVIDSDTYLPVSDGFRPQLQNYLAGCTIGRSNK